MQLFLGVFLSSLLCVGALSSHAATPHSIQFGLPADLTREHVYSLANTNIRFLSQQQKWLRAEIDRFEETRMEGSVHFKPNTLSPEHLSLVRKREGFLPDLRDETVTFKFYARLHLLSKQVENAIDRLVFYKAAFDSLSIHSKIIDQTRTFAPEIKDFSELEHMYPVLLYTIISKLRDSSVELSESQLIDWGVVFFLQKKRYQLELQVRELVRTKDNSHLGEIELKKIRMKEIEKFSATLLAPFIAAHKGKDYAVRSIVEHSIYRSLVVQDNQAESTALKTWYANMHHAPAAPCCNHACAHCPFDLRDRQNGYMTTPETEGLADLSDISYYEILERLQTRYPLEGFGKYEPFFLHSQSDDMNYFSGFLRQMSCERKLLNP